MAIKKELLADLFEQTAKQVTSSLADWTVFLTTVGKLYKYPFHEQLMIYAQNPTATACAEYGLWNNTMNRYVKRGTNGIALIDPSSDRGQIKYVFDVADTGGKENARKPFLWEMHEHHERPILEMLQDKFDVESDSLHEAIDTVALDLAKEYYNDNKSDIAYFIEDSFLEELDDDNIRMTFENALSVSIAYTIMKRMGIDTEDHFTHEDFLPIFDFNTTPTVSFLGAAISKQSEQVWNVNTFLDNFYKVSTRYSAGVL
ncbi:hypothetical protein [Chakrabartyella piscis]|uniref:hypothetical protein n=1 Tax=Chakrabartyella piscis TaxID=2918914 RepID=UPI0029587B1E|nr:hypothetical protein [Chakrabartyella piscis]